MRELNCERCGQRVFFENTRCDACGAALGFVPAELRMGAFEVADIAGSSDWLRLQGLAQRPCSNYRLEQVCNWMVPADADASLCLCCSSTQVIPALNQPENRNYWALMEQAKRRLFYGLLALDLPVAAQASKPGLSFRFLANGPLQGEVVTGHDQGVITLNIAEADDASREQMRAQMHEPYRTLLGHFRHEIGHYFWDRLIAGTAWIDEFRQLFGDEREDYAQALQRHYATPVMDWPTQFISAYASAHPWEDWAECWAHYMHMQDGLETAAAWGLRLGQASAGQASVGPKPLDPQQPLHATLIEEWLPVSQFINAMDRSLGAHDSYPFTVPTPVIDKLEFIHKLIAAQTSVSRAPPSPADASPAHAAPSRAAPSAAT